jgi:hypothetical protein
MTTGSKTATVLELMKRERGVVAKEPMFVTGWQVRSVRGFISGSLGKEMGPPGLNPAAERKTC